MNMWTWIGQNRCGCGLMNEYCKKCDDTKVNDCDCHDTEDELLMRSCR